jgi:hypothetical protein
MSTKKGDDRGLQETAEGAPRRWDVEEGGKFLSINITDSVVKVHHRMLKKFGLSAKTPKNFYRCKS